MARSNLVSVGEGGKDDGFLKNPNISKKFRVVRKKLNLFLQGRLGII